MIDLAVSERSEKWNYWLGMRAKGEVSVRTERFVVTGGLKLEGR